MKRLLSVLLLGAKEFGIIALVQKSVNATADTLY